MLFEDSIRTLASICASGERGMWTAIWSPSKSALKAVHTRGWILIALPSTSTGSKAWMPRRCSVGGVGGGGVEGGGGVGEGGVVGGGLGGDGGGGGVVGVGGGGGGVGGGG